MLDINKLEHFQFELLAVDKATALQEMLAFLAVRGTIVPTKEVTTRASRG